jgi:hypothetical protein
MLITRAHIRILVEYQVAKEEEMEPYIYIYEKRYVCWSKR